MATLFGRYEYAGELGRGASGRVFAVLDRAAKGARRAIKVVPRAESGRLIWEFSRLCQLDHPRVARVWELVRLEHNAPAPFGLSRGALLLVEDFVEGVSLSAALAQLAEDPRVRLEFVMRVAVGVGEALCALHELPLVHGDVKPDNVLCDLGGESLTLIDLGLARAPALASVPRGTPAYMSPELFAGVCTPAADVYALGALLCDALRGEASAPPSRGATPWIERDLRALEGLVDARLVRLLGLFMAREQSKRPADGRAALAAMLPVFTQLGFARAPASSRYAGLTPTRSARERAERARTLPLLGHGGELETLVASLGECELVRVRGPSGSGRSRLIREAIRLLQERRAARSERVPTWVSSLEALALLRDVDAILWLEASAPEEPRAGEPTNDAPVAASGGKSSERQGAGGAASDPGKGASAAQPGAGDCPGAAESECVARGGAPLEAQLRAASVAKLHLRSLCVIVECGPETLDAEVDASFAHAPAAPAIELKALEASAFGALLERLLEPERPSRELAKAIHASCHGLSGRACELAFRMLLEERDLHDLRVWQALALAAPAAHPSARLLSPAATTLASALAWWGSALAPEPALRLFASELELGRAYDELRARGLLIESSSGLALTPGFASTMRASTRAAGGEIARRLALGGARASSGFAQLALGERGQACATFLAQARALRGEGQSDAACALLRDALRWVEDERLSLALADAERACGRYREALAALGAASGPEARLLRAELLRLSDQAELAQQTLDALIEERDPALVARARAQRARLWFDLGELARARAELRELADCGDREAELRALEVEVLACLVSGELTQAPVDALVARASGVRDPAPEPRLPDRPRAEGAGLSRDAQAQRAGPASLHASLGEPLAAQEVAPFLLRAPARARALRAQVLARLGERARALADLRLAVERARALGEAHEAASYALNLGLLELEAGELARAFDTLREAAQRLARMARPRDLARVLYNFAALALLVGDFERAEIVLHEAERELARAPDPVARALIAVVRSELLVSRGLLEGAERGLERALFELPELARSVRALIAARLLQVAVARGAIGEPGDERAQPASAPLARAEAELARAAERADGEESEIRLELLGAELSLALARGDLARAESCAERGLSLAAGAGAAFSARLRFSLLACESARASQRSAARDERSALARSWLEQALSSLPAELRAKMRAVPAYARVLSAGPSEAPVGGELSQPLRPDAQRWRSLVRACRRVFAESRDQRVLERVAELALELVHAERALVLAFDERDELSLRARAELAGETGRLPGFSRSVVERVALEGQPLMTIEARADTRLDRAASVHALSVRSVLCVELFGLSERAFLYLDDRLRPGAFGAEDLELVEDLAELARHALRGAAQLRSESRRARRAEQQQKRLTRELARSQATRAQDPEPKPLVGESAALARVIATARRVASSDAPVLIVGESGTGKELVARFVHDVSPRRARAFVAESCAALPDPLLESALFGHVRGAFTGADRARKGLFETADGGTLFLDEVGEMSASLQGKLLRVLQEGELRPLGSERTRAVDVRVIGATRRDLLALVRAGRFREDLYYRLAVVTLELPSLAERPEDVPLLVAHFLEKHAPGRKVRIQPSALRALETRAWPGNVRELENEVRRALALCDAEIAVEHFSRTEAPDPSLEAGELDLHARTERLTRQLVEQALRRVNGNVTRAAALLGISRYGLQKILKRIHGR